MNAAAHIGVQNEWLLYVVLQPNFYYLLQTRPTCKFALMTIFPPTTTSHDRWIGNNKQLKCSVPFPRNVQLSSRRLYTRNHSLSDSLIHSALSQSGSHRANMTQQFHPTNRWFCAFCAIRHRHATVNTSCKWPTEGIGTPQNGRQNVTLSVYDRKATTEAIVQNSHHHPAAISCPCSERESEMTAKPPSDSQ